MEWKYWGMGEDSGSLASTSYLWSLNKLFNIPLEYLSLILLWQDFISFGKTRVDKTVEVKALTCYLTIYEDLNLSK